MSRDGDKSGFVGSIQAVERETLNDRVYRELRTMIMSGGFEPGAEMTLRTLAQGLRVSLMPVRDAHLCCGSAGTYSLLQPELSGKLKAAKLQALEADRPDVIATANIGCLAHLADGAKRPVRHWIELLDERMLGGR